MTGKSTMRFISSSYVPHNNKKGYILFVRFMYWEKRPLLARNIDACYMNKILMSVLNNMPI